MFTGELRDFQRPAVKKMLRMGAQLLVFDMGLGKTPTTLAVIEDLLECGDARCGMWVTLASLKIQAYREIRKFTTSDALIVEGTKQQRARIYRQYREGRWPYLIMNYEQPRDDWDEIADLPRDFVVLDEATAISNFSSARGKATKRLHAPFKFGLTGTPLENRVDELFGLMEWVEPEVLGRWDVFDRTFIVRHKTRGYPVATKNVGLLREVMEPWWYRVTHAEIADQLPEVVPVMLPVQLDSKSSKLYNQIASDLLIALQDALEEVGPRFNLWGYYSGENEAVTKARGRVMSRFTALRMVCAHPQLLKISAEKFKRTEGKSGSEYAASLLEEGVLDNLPDARPKMNALIDRLRMAREAGHKSVVFTGWVEMLNLLLQGLEKAKINAVPYHGELSQREREAFKMRFKEDPGTHVMVSSDAGGYGVDLPEGRVLLNYDMPWTAGRLKQRNGRIVRLSSEHETVYIGDVLVLGSVEEWMAEKVSVKRNLGDVIVDGKGTVDKQGRVDASGGSLISFLLENSP